MVFKCVPVGQMNLVGGDSCCRNIGRGRKECSAIEDGRANELFGDAAEIRVERVVRGLVAQEQLAVFGGEDQMNASSGKGLWHSTIQDAPFGHSFRDARESFVRRNPVETLGELSLSLLTSAATG